MALDPEEALEGRPSRQLQLTTGGAERTIAVRCGDNGSHLGEKLHWRKFALWKEATRVPLILAGPSIPAGRRIEEQVNIIDLYPTIPEAAGQTFDGRDVHSLKQLLVLPDGARPRGVVMTWGANNHSIRTRRWRFTR
jgi:arylsulfatase A-like enzyme